MERRWTGVQYLVTGERHLAAQGPGQQRLQWTKTDDLVGDLLEHAHALGASEGQALLVDRNAEDFLDLAPHLDLVG